MDSFSLKVALSVSMLFAKAKVTDLPPLSSLAFKFLPALKVKVSPALRAWSSAVFPFAVPSSISSVVLSTFTKVAASLIALATSPTVATFLLSVSSGVPFAEALTVTLPRLLALAP